MNRSDSREAKMGRHLTLVLDLSVYDGRAGGWSAQRGVGSDLD